MSQSYYEILEISPDATNEDIANAYRRLSIKFHPKRNSTKDFAINNYQFHLISEAFIVLNSSILRGVYDTYGKEALKNGVIDDKGNLKGGYKYDGSAFSLFEKFFGTFNPFAVVKDGQIITDEYGSMFGNSFGGFNEIKQELVPDIKVELLLELEEIFTGGVKVLSYDRRVLNEDKRTTTIKNTLVNVEVPRGVEENSEILFNSIGNEEAGKKPSNLIVLIKSKKHRNFIRNKQDLITTCKINLVEAISSTPVEVITLDGRKIQITMDEIISPQTVKRVEGEGLPLINEKKVFVKNLPRGDLFVKFDIKFPKFLNQNVKDELVSLLEN